MKKDEKPEWQRPFKKASDDCLKLYDIQKLTLKWNDRKVSQKRPIIFLFL